MTLKRAFTLFLCAAIILFIFVGPETLDRYRVDYRKSYEPEKSMSKWQGVITLWDYPRLDIRDGSRFTWIKNKIKEFEKLNPGVYIEFSELDWESGPTFLRAAANTGAHPDIAPVGSDYYYICRGFLERLNDYIDEEEIKDYTESALSSVSDKGNIYGLPWMMTGYTMLLNKDIFADRGVPIPENGNWTYEQFTEALKKLTYDTNRRGGPDVFGFNSFIEPGHYNIFGLLMCDGAQIIDSDTGKYVFYYPEALSALKKLYDLKHKLKVTHPKFGIMNEKEAWTSFLEGKVAVYTGGSWSIPLLRKFKDSGEIDYEIANFPTGSAEMPITMNSNICSYAVFKQEDEGKKQVCIDFIKFITSKDNQKDLLNFGYFPVRKSGMYLYQNDKEMSAVMRSLNFAEPMPRHPNFYMIDIILQSKIKAVLNGELTPEQALEEARQKIESK